MSKEKTTMLTVVEQEERRYELTKKQASAYMYSTVVPEAYRLPAGATTNSPVYFEKLGNCMVAYNMAARMNIDILEVMQNMYVVHGNPTFKSSFIIGRINSSKRFSPLRYEFRGEAGKPDYGCRAYAYETTDTGKKEPLYGDWITWSMVQGEGWDRKPGSKWKTMADQMFRYRAAAFWQRVYCPEISMGVMTEDEANDIAPVVTITTQQKSDIDILRNTVAQAMNGENDEYIEPISDDADLFGNGQ